MVPQFLRSVLECVVPKVTVQCDVYQFALSPRSRYSPGCVEGHLYDREIEVRRRPDRKPVKVGGPDRLDNALLGQQAHQPVAGRRPGAAHEVLEVLPPGVRERVALLGVDAVLIRVTLFRIDALRVEPPLYPPPHGRERQFP